VSWELERVIWRAVSATLDDDYDSSCDQDSCTTSDSENDPLSGVLNYLGRASSGANKKKYQQGEQNVPVTGDFKQVRKFKIQFINSNLGIRFHLFHFACWVKCCFHIRLHLRIEMQFVCPSLTTVFDPTQPYPILPLRRSVKLSVVQSSCPSTNIICMLQLNLSIYGAVVSAGRWHLWYLLITSHPVQSTCSVTEQGITVCQRPGLVGKTSGQFYPVLPWVIG